MIRYFKLFDLLNRREMKKSDLREILSPKTIAKLSKGNNIETDVIDKICLFLNCQPGDIMEVVEVEEIDENSQFTTVKRIEATTISGDITIEETFAETKPSNMTITESDEIGETKRQSINEDVF